MGLLHIEEEYCNILYAPNIGLALMFTTCSKALSSRSELLAFSGSGCGSVLFTGIVSGLVKAAGYTLCCFFINFHHQI